jgi:heterodisulfide reductase subunit A
VKEVLVIGGGIAGIQTALDLAEQGLRVHLVERSPSIGGRMAQLDKTFPTNDCSTCILSPKMVDCSRHPNIVLHTYSQVQALTGEAGSFAVRLLKRPRYVDESLCTGCGDCARKCPRKMPDPFNVGLDERRAIYLLFPQAVPMVMTIDPEHCTYLTRGKCGLCQKICQAGAIDFEQQEQELDLEVGAVVVATGYDFYDPTSIGQYHYHLYPNVITALEYERLISASGPTGSLPKRSVLCNAPVHDMYAITAIALRSAVYTRSKKRSWPGSTTTRSTPTSFTPICAALARVSANTWIERSGTIT